MKSLKRTLCLVLALVMVLGLFGIASATNFTDDNTIQYKEAVDVVTGIGAINGMGDGTFAPKGTITRAQAAKLVTFVALSKGVAENLTGVTSSFTDVTAAGGFAWAIPSIEYLVKQGTINGRGDGTFDPNGEISGYAVLKLLLCALGYGTNDEYVGDGWDLQVAIDANKAGLTKGRASNASALSAAATREEVALYCFNALNATVVAYSKIYDQYVALGSSTNNDLTLGQRVYGLTKVASPVAIKSIKLDTDKTSKTFGKLIAGDNATFNSSTNKFVVDSYNMIGHKVKLWKDANGAVVSATPTTFAVDVYGMTAAEWKAAITDKGYVLDAVYLYTNCVEGGSASFTPAAPVAPAVYTNANTLIFETNPTTGATAVVAAQLNSYTLQKVNVALTPAGAVTATLADTTYYTTGGTEAIGLTAGKFYDTTDTTPKDGVPDLDKDASNIDWASYIVPGTAAGVGYFRVQAIDGMLYFTELPTVTGKITAKDEAASTKTVTMNGTTYKSATGVLDGINKTSLPTTGSKISTLNFKDTYKAYIDPTTGMMISIDTAPGETSTEGYMPAFVAEDEEVTVGSGFAATKAFNVQVVFVDGTYGTYALASLDGKTPVKTVTDASTQIAFADDNLKGEFVLAKLDGTSVSVLTADASSKKFAGTTYVNGENLEITGTKTTTVPVNLTKTAISLTAATVKYYINSESAFIYYDGEGTAAFKATVVKGAHDLGVTDSTGGMKVDFMYNDASATGGLKTVSVAAIDGAYTPSAVDTSNVYYVEKYLGQTADGYQYQAYNVGSTEPTTLTTQTAYTSNCEKLFYVLASSVNSKGVTEYRLTKVSTLDDIKANFKETQTLSAASITLDGNVYVNATIKVISGAPLIDIRTDADKAAMSVASAADLKASMVVSYVLSSETATSEQIAYIVLEANS